MGETRKRNIIMCVQEKNISYVQCSDIAAFQRSLRKCSRKQKYFTLLS